MEIETKIKIIIIGILFLILSLVFGIITAILFRIFKYFSNRFNWTFIDFTNKNIFPYLLIISSIFSLSQAYTAVYPNDSFYYDEFEYVTNRAIPKSAKIKFKNSSYPGIQGDYFSKSIIELSPQDYIKLLLELKNDKSLRLEKGICDQQECIMFERKIAGESDRFLIIKFLKDKKTVVVNIDFT